MSMHQSQWIYSSV